MTAIQDPYPEELEPGEVGVIYTGPPDPLVAAVNRLAQAIEQNTLALLHPVGTPHPPVQNAPRQATGGLAPLPPVQQVTIVPGAPPCPLHGPDKVAPSKLGSGGFYCQAKAALGQPANAKGYCVWHT